MSGRNGDKASSAGSAGVRRRKILRRKRTRELRKALETEPASATRTGPLGR
jgi:hypothetical protein